MILTALGSHFRRLTYSTERAGFALLAGDASLVLGLRQNHVPRAWRVYSATGFDFREKKNRASLGSIGAATLPSASYLNCHYTM